jgi:hypothetical protein
LNAPPTSSLLLLFFAAAFLLLLKSDLISGTFHTCQLKKREDDTGSVFHDLEIGTILIPNTVFSLP